MIQADVEQESWYDDNYTDPGSAAQALVCDSRGSSVSIIQRLMQNLLYPTAPGPSLLSQNDKCRSHPPCSTNLDRARQTMRGATHALISFRCVTICQMRRGGEALPGLRPGPKRLLQARRSRGFPCHQPTISLAQRHKNDAELLHRFSIPPPSDCFLPQHFESFFSGPYLDLLLT